MNDLLFYAILIALLYYFFVYLPQQKKPLELIKLTKSQETQTEKDDLELEKTLDQLIKNIQQLNQQIK